MTAGLSRRGLAALAAAFAAAAGTSRAGVTSERPLRIADIGAGVQLHYLEAGSGEPVVFVHGSLGDLNYWTDQVDAFGAQHRAIAYSRRYSYPNQNAAILGYSAEMDAQDLAGFIRSLGIAPAHVVGHSYGALTALFLAARRPELVRTVTLAEPPAVSLLQHVPEPHAAAAKAMHADIYARMVEPMQAAFRSGRRETGVGVFIDYVFGRPGAWGAMSALARTQTLCDAAEWDVMMTHGTLFPVIVPEAVRAIRTPTLILSGAKSYPFLGMIDEALMALLPNRSRVVFPDAGHQMWLQHPDDCRRAVLQLMAGA